MLKTRELRIGNLISFKGLWHGEVSEVYNYFIKIGSRKSSYPCDVLSGIPLTPEWLLKLGFDMRPKNDDFDRWNIEGVGEEIWQHDHGFCHDFAFGGDLLYVHQLQNLIHALTGKELTYTP